MNGILVLIPVALGLGLLGLFAFFWAVGRGQFDDLDGAALRIFIDDEGDTRTPEARDDD
ncbi:cbb3-type cytochrome oxidase assembly protein CcoS [Sandarakinorhabdus sp.]|uniref:cbb3-type cytochrome oxidase assembly protein CcoS n=1 Tax=Sandarakinorhabdus sp. TaxID=1916663 RepID=UPI003F728184